MSDAPGTFDALDGLSRAEMLEIARRISTEPPVDETYEPDPSDVQQLMRALMSWRWRIFSGRLYRIMVKSEDEATGGHVVPFVPNRAQRRFLERLHTRNVILKARQLGFSTLIAILWLDHALYVRDQRCGIVCHDLDSAFTIFRDKIKFGYESLPPAVRTLFPVLRMSQSEILFGHNNSGIRVATSMRSGTIHRLHVSEMGKMAAKHPEKAAEVVTGSLPAVPQDGIAVIESTAEGQDGDFFRIATRAEEIHEIGRDLADQEFSFHFFPWHEEPTYVADPRHATITDDDHAYFDGLELELGILLSMPQRAFYVLKRDGEMGGDVAKMWREYPSTPKECWQQATEGRYYARQLAMARTAGRIRPRIEHDPSYPVHTFWDIGSRDGTGIWVMQTVGEEDRFLRYLEDWQEGYSTFISRLADLNWIFGTHYLPHDAGHERQGHRGVLAPIDILEELAPHWQFAVLPPIARRMDGIEFTRKHFPRAIFDEEGCKAGLIHLSNYQARWNSVAGAWSEEPLKNEATEAADSFRQWAQAREMGALKFSARSRKRQRRATGGMAA